MSTTGHPEKNFAAAGQPAGIYTSGPIETLRPDIIQGRVWKEGNVAGQDAVRTPRRPGRDHPGNQRRLYDEQYGKDHRGLLSELRASRMNHAGIFAATDKP